MQVLVDLLRREALKTNELLRHFWRAVPATTQARGAKAGKLAGHLAEQQRVLGSHMAARPGDRSGGGWGGYDARRAVMGRGVGDWALWAHASRCAAQQLPRAAPPGMMWHH